VRGVRATGPPVGAAGGGGGFGVAAAAGGALVVCASVGCGAAGADGTAAVSGAWFVLRLWAGGCVLFGLTVMGAADLNDLWSVAVAVGGIFSIVVWVVLNMAWEER
jgi:hypothetical protein